LEAVEKLEMENEKSAKEDVAETNVQHAPDVPEIAWGR
jgi:hypothetical protein